MTLRSLAAAALTGLLSAPIVRSAEPVSPPSHITEITLYGDRADVRREAKAVRLRPGENRIAFTLPPALIEESVRAAGYGAPGMRVMNIEVQNEGDHSLRLPGAEAVAINDEIIAIEARLAGLAAGDEFLKAIRPGISSDGASHLDRATLAERHSFLVETTSASAEESDRLRHAREEKQSERHRLLREAQRTSANRAPHRAIVEIRSETEILVDLSLEYAVTSATWSPDYDVEVAEDFSSLRVEYFGILSQSTGEDWHGAHVTLSTARPSREFARRDLEPWTLVSPPPPQENVVLRKKEASSTRAIDISGQTKIRAINTTQETLSTVVETSFWTASFAVEETIDLPSDGSPRRMRIAVIPLDSDVRHEAVPQHADHALLVAETRNDTARPLLRGRTHVTLAGAYLGRGWMEEVAPGQDFTITLGEDPYVSVERNLVERSEKVRDERSWRTSRDLIEVVNRRDRAIEVTLRDRIPVSADRDVHVKTIEISPKTEPHDDGILEWRLEVGAGETVRTHVAYEVRHPTGRRPQNL